jgi:hypothetical protein
MLATHGPKHIHKFTSTIFPTFLNFMYHHIVKGAWL